jgi:hypothetical protein
MSLFFLFFFLSLSAHKGSDLFQTIRDEKEFEFLVGPMPVPEELKEASQTLSSSSLSLPAL